MGQSLRHKKGTLDMGGKNIQFTRKESEICSKRKKILIDLRVQTPSATAFPAGQAVRKIKAILKPQRHCCFLEKICF